MKRISVFKIFMLVALLITTVCPVWGEQVTKDKITIQYEPAADGGIKVINAWNRSEERIELKIDGKIITINPNSSVQVNQHASRFVRFDYKLGGGNILWKPTPKKEKVVEKVPEPAAETPKVNEQAERPRDEKRNTEKRESQALANPVDTSIESLKSPDDSAGYFDNLNNDNFFGMDAVTAYLDKVSDFCSSIETAHDKKQYIIDNDIELFIQNSEKEIEENKINIPFVAQKIVIDSHVSPGNMDNTRSLIIETLTNRLKMREEACQKLKNAVAKVNEDLGASPKRGNGIWWIVILLVAIVATGLFLYLKKKKKKGTATDTYSKAVSGSPHVENPDNPAIVVRRRTTSILKKQNIDDAKDNPAYLVIDASEFTPDSAVRKIYIKNTCIKSVYDLYAEDLRNSENPKEDGCMVLGRWVRNDDGLTYDITLEEVVLPGDDAVFKEYELNFGGKIKLRIAEKLRKLRKDTDLQYDLVCWIHSHPGLGVFFSNSDNNVQMQLKNSEHPKFLIAFVIDILTSNQEMGIFTFRKDGTMNSKNDLTRMYSLEEMYKWSLESERSSFSHDNYYNLLSDAKVKLPSCAGVELNNSSIIDLTQIIISEQNGVVAWAIGTTVESKGGAREFAVSSLVSSSIRPGTGVIGCLICEAHVSLPTIQRLISPDCANLKFVLVYSSKQLSLTTIPVINGELVSNELFYGNVKIDDLKIWTRRRR